MANIIEAKILTGPFKGEDVLNREFLLFQFKRLQIPFAITINKALGQSLELCGLYLHTDCFSHWRLYVACSRVGDPDNLFIYTETGTTKNIVYLQVLEN